MLDHTVKEIFQIEKQFLPTFHDKNIANLCYDCLFVYFLKTF
jgi:hypothetical protein